LNDIEFSIHSTKADPPKGFLFLCPPKDFQIGQSSLRWLDCPAYWSLDPLGLNTLSLEDAASLGFPAPELSMNVSASWWDASVYAGLRQFHQAKGFDPENRAVVRYLECPLYELSNKIDVPFGHSKSTVSSGRFFLFVKRLSSL
jgi:hypothetical protein